ncbi:hypothetical protein BH10PSE16_BH10PSE16_04310 [soil metagenome]
MKKPKVISVNQMSLFGDVIEIEEPPASVAVLKPVAKAVETLTKRREMFVLESKYFAQLTGPAAKVKANLAAVKMAMQGGKKSLEEKAVIVAYSGWGGISAMFADNGDFEAQRLEFLEMVGEKSYAQARDSVLTAYYTEPEVIQAMWGLVQKMGFKGGKVLEPSAGTGNFIGAMPVALREASTITMVEPDSVSATICKALYADSDTLVHTCGMEIAPLRSESFDVVIGNVPFGNYRVHDSKFDCMKLVIHDYAIAKSLDLVRAGGIVAVITSTGTMDKPKSNFREYIAERADLVTAIRLPSGAFTRLGETDVATDILVLRKKPKVADSHVGHDFKVAEVIKLHEFGNMNERSYDTINAFYSQNQRQLLGMPKASTNQFGACLKFVPELAWGEQLKTMCSDATLDGWYTHEERKEIRENFVADMSGLKTMVASGFFFDDQGQLYYMTNQNAESQAHLPEPKRRRIEGMTHIRNCVVELLELDSVGANSTYERAKLNRLYDAFVVKYDYLMKPYNRRLFSLDSHAPLLWSLERYDDENEKAVKTDIFSKSTVSAAVLSETAESLSDAIALSYNRFARLDLAFMAKALSLGEDEVVQKLLDANRVFFDPESREYVDSEVYLSGKVLEKLLVARAAAEGDERYMLNVAALEAVVPATVPLSKVSIQLGVPWIGQEDVQAFVDEIVTLDAEKVQDYNDIKAVTVTQVIGMAVWSVTMGNRFQKETRYSGDWGTAHRPFDDLLSDLLNQRSTTVYMEIEVEPGKTKRIVNKDETLAARDKAEKIQAAFTSWVYADPERVQRLEFTYNSKFNGTLNREFDGAHLVVPGLSSAVKLRSDQLDGIWAGLIGGNKLYAYAVGGGKTLITICLAQMMKRLGFAKKPTIVVPNHMLEEFAGQYARAFPRARILAASKEDLEGDKRRVLMMRLAMEDWDCIIITHGSFGKIALSKQVVQDFADEAGEKIDAMISGSDDRNVVREAVRQKKTVIAKVMALAEKGKKDDGVLTFDQLGIDQLLVDEADLFKNLWFQTKKTRVPGLSSACSGRALDLFLKSRIIFERRKDGFGLVFATATPIANTIGEMFIMQTYLQPDRLKELGIDGFDAWAANFAREVTSIEVTPDGGGYRMHTRFSQFVNVPELMLIFKEVALIRTKAMLALPEPKVAGGRHCIVAARASEAQKAYVQKLVDRATAIREGKVKPHEDNMLCVTGDGRRSALDMRCVDGLEMDHAGSKLNACIENVYRHWAEGREKKLTQLVFCDLSTPKAHGFSVYTDMREKLVLMGVPVEEIAFAQDYKTTAQKGELHRKVRSGRIRILQGSTELMGFGTNVQDRLVAEHHLDAPWRPRDVEQRDGRIIRQGNLNEEVFIYRYVTESTFDAYMWQTLERKAGFIAQVMEGKTEMRSVEDVTSQALSFAEVKAIASGNPLVIEKAGVDAEVSKILSLKAAWRSDREIVLSRLANCVQSIDYSKKRIQAFEGDLGSIGNASEVTLGGMVHSASDKTGKSVMAHLASIKASVTTKEHQWRSFDALLAVGNMSIGLELHGKIGSASYKFFAKGSSGVSFEFTLPYGAKDIEIFLRSKHLETDLMDKLSWFRTRLIADEAELINLKRGAEKPFEYAERLEAALNKQEEIDKSLDLRADDVSTLFMEEEKQEEAEMAS